MPLYSMVQKKDEDGRCFVVVDTDNQQYRVWDVFYNSAVKRLEGRDYTRRPVKEPVEFDRRPLQGDFTHVFNSAKYIGGLWSDGCDPLEIVRTYLAENET